MRSVKIISDTESVATEELPPKSGASKPEPKIIPAKEEKKESPLPAEPPLPKPPVKIINPLPPQKPVAPKVEPKPPVKEEKKETPPKAGEGVGLLDFLKKNVVSPPVKIETAKPVAPPPSVKAPSAEIKKEEVMPSAPKPVMVKKEALVAPPSKKITKDISEAELDREIQHIKHDQMTKVALPPINFTEIAAGIVSQSKIILNPEQAARLQTILTARLKDIRDGQETKDILSRDYVMGGMSFAESQVGAVMPILEQEFKKISERLRAEAEEKISAERRAEEEKRKTTAETDRLREEQSRDKRFSELVGESSRKKVIPAPPKVPSGKPVVASPAQAGKPKIQDIKYEPKLVGPVDEIGSLTLVDFRRLGATAKEATLKVKEKIESLKAESIKKWQEGVSAWNGGEVNKLYLQLFGEALQKRKSLKEISAGRESAGEPSLSQDEINAIIELNRSLRF
jgi:hypothetical protein